MAGGETQLHDPLLCKLERANDPRVSKRVNCVEQRVRHVVVVRGQLRLNARNGQKASYADIQSLLNGEIQIHIFKDRIKSILPIELEKLLAEIAFGCRKAIVNAVERGEVIAIVEVLILHRVGQTLDVNDSLIQLNLVGEDVVRQRKVIRA